jgi:hypothetical protein
MAFCEKTLRLVNFSEKHALAEAYSVIRGIGFRHGGSGWAKESFDKLKSFIVANKKAELA